VAIALSSLRAFRRIPRVWRHHWSARGLLRVLLRTAGRRRGGCGLSVPSAQVQPCDRRADEQGSHARRTGWTRETGRTLNTTSAGRYRSKVRRRLAFKRGPIGLQRAHDIRGCFGWYVLKVRSLVVKAKSSASLDGELRRFRPGVIRFASRKMSGSSRLRVMRWRASVVNGMVAGSRRCSRYDATNARTPSSHRHSD
jgi:hypothetical protein